MSKVISSTGQAPLTVTQYGIFIGSGAGQATANTVINLTNGQILVGSTGLAPVAASLGAGYGLTVATGAGTLSAGLDLSVNTFRAACRLATTAALTATYNNGSSGVGATLTNSGTQAALTIDGQSAVVNDRVLVKNQASQLQNGVYTVTNIGSGATNWVLTRATDFDGSIANCFTYGSIVFVVTGASAAGGNQATLWYFSQTAAITIGTTAITIAAINGLNITRLGAISTGTWNADNITVANGGTGVASLSAHRLIAGGTTNTGALQSVAENTATSNLGNVLTNGVGGTSLPSYTTIPGRNRLINGDMSIWQNGTSFSVPASTTQYTADGWQVLTNANQACTVSQQAGTAPQGNNYLRFQRNSGQTGTGVMRVCQSLPLDASYMGAGTSIIIGGGSTLAIAISLIARKGTNFSGASNNLTYTLYGGTGAANKSGINGAFTGSTAIATGTITLTASSAATRILASNVTLATYTQFALELSYAGVGTAGAADYFEITDVQLEQAAGATPFDRRTFNENLANCQRFLRKSFPYGTIAAQNSGTYSGAAVYSAQVASTVAGYTTMVYLNGSMIADTAPTFYSPSSATAKWYNISGSADSGTASCAYHSTECFTINNPQVVADAAANLMAVHWQIDARLV